MLKSISFGIGIFLLVVGLSLHAIDSYTVRPSVAAQATGVQYGPMQTEAKTVIPEPWKPWVYLGAGRFALMRQGLCAPAAVSCAIDVPL